MEVVPNTNDLLHLSVLHKSRHGPLEWKRNGLQHGTTLLSGLPLTKQSKLYGRSNKMFQKLRKLSTHHFNIPNSQHSIGTNQQIPFLQSHRKSACYFERFKSHIKSYSMTYESIDFPSPLKLLLIVF